MVALPIDKLTFKNANHCHRYYCTPRGTAEHAIDWDKDATPYKEPLNGIRVYAGGDIEIDNFGYRQPYWRRQFKELTGFEIILVKRTPGMRFKTPDGRHIAKRLINDNMLLLDSRSKCVYAMPRRYGSDKSVVIRKDLRFPINTAPLSLNMPNLTREKELLDLFEPARAVGLTLERIEPQPLLGEHLIYQAEQSIQNEKPPTDFTDKYQVGICRSFAKHPKETTRLIKHQARNIKKFEFLKFEYVKK